MLHKYLILILVRELILSRKIVLRNGIPFTSANFQGPFIYGKTHLTALLNSSTILYCSLPHAIGIVSHLFDDDFSKHTLPELATRYNKLHLYGFNALEIALLQWGYSIDVEIPKHCFLRKCYELGSQYIDPKDRALAILDQIFFDNF